LSTNWKFTNCKQKPLLLFSSLDWGLGHTTRSVPLLKEFLNLGCDLVVACNSIQKKILQPEFPALRYVELEGYSLNYGSDKWSTRIKILLQLKKILTRINQENAWLRSFIKENKVDALISDNRYGFYHPKIPSVLITHQLHIHSGYGAIADKLSQFLIYRFVNRFSVCWVPDNEKTNGLAGKLSHPRSLPAVPVRYLGPVSRFDECESNSEKNYDALIILSGPEPQRTILETIMLEQSEPINKKIALVRGLPEQQPPLYHKKITTFNHLNSAELNKLICESQLIIGRSGYTTIMDMIKLKKKMAVIPTPGQPEQEYLAKHLSENHLALTYPQYKFSLPQIFDDAANFKFAHADLNMNEFKIVLKEFVEKISS
jgi:uncharacterized protein (TIGR00661 family)